MRTITKLFSTCAFLLAGVLLLLGCTDSNYNLGNLDKTIAIGSEQGFSLPGNNSTSELVLDDILDIENNDVIKVSPDGGYYFSRGADEDDIEPALPVVDEIPLTRVSDESDYEYDLGEVLDVEEARQMLEGSVSSTAQCIYSFEFSNIDQIADVLGLSLANLRAGANIDLNFTDELKRNIGNIEELILDLPAFFDIDVESRYANEAVMQFNKETNTFRFTKLTDNGIHLRLMLNGVDFLKGSEPDEYGCYLKFSPDSVTMMGAIWLDVKYVENDADARGVKKAEKHENFKILCHSSIDETIMLTAATGNFTPEITFGGKEGESLGEFDVEDLPDFLDDERAHLNVDNPELRIWIDSNMDIEGIIKEARINAIDANGNKVSVDINTDNLFIDPHTGKERDVKGDSLTSTKTKLIICDRLPAIDNPQPHTYYATPKNGKMSDLLYNIPRKVTFDCTVAANEKYTGTIRLGYKNSETNEPWYTIQPSFEVYAPLAFNEGSVIVYNDSITGWHEDLKDISLSDGATVILTGTVVNSIPLDLKMHAHALELQGPDRWGEIDKNQIEVRITDANDQEDFLIKAGEVSNPVPTPIKITMTQRGKAAFKRIDGICYNATAMGSADLDKQGIILNSMTQKLQVLNIGVTLRGKIIVDMND